jgi:hypothetical protein
VVPQAGARGIYTPRGESLGYLAADSQLVVHPGYTRDLTSPYPQRLIQVAMAKVPEADRKDSTVLFDVNGAYVGYLSNSGFYPSTRTAQATLPQVAQAGQPQVAQAVGAPPGGGEESTNWTPWIFAGIATLIVTGTLGGLAASGQFSGGGDTGGTTGGTTEGTPSTATQPQ